MHQPAAQLVLYQLCSVSYQCTLMSAHTLLQLTFKTSVRACSPLPFAACMPVPPCKWLLASLVDYSPKAGHMRWSLSCEAVCGAGANKYHEQILPLLLDVCQSPEASIRQSALYGLGTVAQRQPHLFQKIAADAISRIGQVIAAPNSRQAPTPEVLFSCSL